MTDEPKTSDENESSDGAPATVTPVIVAKAKDLDPMYLAALVLGFNEMRKNAKTLGDQIFFTLHRDTLHAALTELNQGWQVNLVKKYVAVRAEVDAAGVITVHLDNGRFVEVAVGRLVARVTKLRGVPLVELQKVQIAEGGLSLRWPDLDAAVSLAHLVETYGSCEP